MLLLAVAAALPYFFSLNDYIPQIEQEASTRLGEPVSIKHISFAALPEPHATVEGVALGAGGDVKFGKVQVVPDVFSLLQPTRVIKRIEIDSLVLTKNGIGKIRKWARPVSGSQPARLRIESIRLDNARFDDGRAGFGPFDARLALDGRGEPESASIATRDGKVRALVKFADSAYQIDVHAKSWTLPLGPALVFDELTVRATITGKHADLSEVSARLYGGEVVGKAAIDWDQGLRLDGSFDVSQMELQQLAAILSSGTHFSGRLNAKPVFSASAPDVDQIMNVLHLESPFSVRNGELHGVDIRKAATSLSRTSGGDTHFEQLSGYLAMARGGYRFTQLRIASGSLTVDGDVSVSPGKKLSGRINAKVKEIGTSVPLNVAGTVDAPLLYPTGAAMAGAAVGTVVLGPGLGTSVGAKVGNWAEGLFGGRKKK